MDWEGSRRSPRAPVGGGGDVQTCSLRFWGFVLGCRMMLGVWGGGVGDVMGDPVR